MSLWCLSATESDYQACEGTGDMSSLLHWHMVLCQQQGRGRAPEATFGHQVQSLCLQRSSGCYGAAGGKLQGMLLEEPAVFLSFLTVMPGMESSEDEKTLVM